MTIITANAPVWGPKSSIRAAKRAERIFARSQRKLCVDGAKNDPGATAGEIGFPYGLDNAQAGRRLSDARRDGEVRNCQHCVLGGGICVYPCKHREFKYCRINGDLMQRWYHRDYVAKGSQLELSLGA